MQNRNSKNNILNKNIGGWKLLIAIFITFFILLISFISSEKNKENLKRNENKQQEISNTTPVLSNPKSIGRWFGKTEVYLSEENGKYVALFEPPISSEENIYQYLAGLLNEVFGLLPSSLSNPQITGELIFYMDVKFNEYYFLIFKDSGNVAGVSFWKK